MKWGIIGPGNIAHDFVNDFKHLSSLQQVVSVFNYRKKSAREFATEFGVAEIFTDLESFVTGTTAEIIYVATPHTKHFEEVKACLNAGMHVLCEKPLGINRMQYEELYKLAAEKKVYLMEGMWLRFLPHITRLLEQVNSGSIGKVLSVKASMCFNAPDDPNSRYFDPELGGGSLLDLGIYTVFLGILLLGKPDIIKAVGHLTDQGIDDTCSILFGYNDGRHAILESSLLYNTDQPAVVIGDKGQINILNPWFEKSGGLEIHRDNQEIEKWPSEWAGHGLQFEADAVINDIREGRTSNATYTPELSLAVIDAIDEIRRQLGIVYEKYEESPARSER